MGLLVYKRLIQINQKGYNLVALILWNMKKDKNCASNDLACGCNSFLKYWGPPILLIVISSIGFSSQWWSITVSGVLWSIGIFWIGFLVFQKWPSMRQGSLLPNWNTLSSPRTNCLSNHFQSTSIIMGYILGYLYNLNNY